MSKRGEKNAHQLDSYIKQLNTREKTQQGKLVLMGVGLVCVLAVTAYFGFYRVQNTPKYIHIQNISTLDQDDLVSYLSQKNTFLVLEDRLLDRLDTIRNLDDYLELVSLNNAYAQDDNYDELAFLDEEGFEEDFMEPHNMYIEGSMMSGDDLTFYISGYRESLTYTLDFGNGIKRRVDDTYEYAYKKRGHFKVRLTVRDEENILEELEQDIQIFEDRALAVVEERPPSRPKEEKKAESRRKKKKEDDGENTNSSRKKEEKKAEEKADTKKKDSLTSPKIEKPAPKPKVIRKPKVEKEVSRSEEVTKPNIELPVAAKKEESTSNRPMAIAEVMPSFPGGDRALRKYLAKNIHYPQAAKGKEVEGRVYIQFIVEQDGTLSNLKIMRGIGYGCNEEAMRVVKAMPSWKPGEQAGRKVPVIYTLPIRFSLQ
ncbi:MAG: TonB family protein [Bacteroidota bacterium]